MMTIFLSLTEQVSTIKDWLVILQISEEVQ